MAHHQKCHEKYESTIPSVATHNMLVDIIINKKKLPPTKEMRSLKICMCFTNVQNTSMHVTKHNRVKCETRELAFVLGQCAVNFPDTNYEQLFEIGKTFPELGNVITNQRVRENPKRDREIIEMLLSLNPKRKREIAEIFNVSYCTVNNLSHAITPEDRKKCGTPK